ncbi:hypothetical protein FIBSPDRAFT_956406 [Athelia psychrophila]|uniref:Uncharacterized protein n=1 Tax=Athelia psychrophila TaxID=1759441 RepID=A0A166GWB5_9AGAM|nr:hypothetical protein FIBSPDRAFT_956406 [Fibularhizoctonia sp. CBS 109695]
MQQAHPHPAHPLIQPVRSSSPHLARTHGYSPQVRTPSLCTHPCPPARAHEHLSCTASPVAHPTTSHLTTHVAQPRRPPKHARSHDLRLHPPSPHLHSQPQSRART